jgi:hypothetical protein
MKYFLNFLFAQLLIIGYSKRNIIFNMIDNIKYKTNNLIDYLVPRINNTLSDLDIIDIIILII